MTCESQTISKLSNPTAVTALPPATIEETGWDILMALRADRNCTLGLQKLASVASVPEAVMIHWLSALERRELITGEQHPFTGAIKAILTPKGRELLDRYFAATGDLRVGTHH